MHRIFASVAAALIITSSFSAAAGERPYFTNVKDFKPGQCAYAGYAYEQGEMLKMTTSITKVCTQVKGRSVWLSVDMKDLEELTY